MSFEQLIAKVKQAEDALEARERSAAADFRQLKSSWKLAWTPPRIVIAGLVSGFFVGRAEPLRRTAGKAGGGGVLQMISMLSGLFASGAAQVAASDASDAAQDAQQDAAAGDAAAARPAAQTRNEQDLLAMAAAAAAGAGFLRDGPRRRETHPTGPVAAEAATEVSER